MYGDNLMMHHFRAGFKKHSRSLLIIFVSVFGQLTFISMSILLGIFLCKRGISFGDKMAILSMSPALCVWMA